MMTLKSPPSPPSLPLVTRLPKSGQKEPYSGLSRTWLDLLTRPQPGNNFDPPVQSHILAVKGAGRGVRLINVRSLLDYVSSLSGEQPGRKKKMGAKRGRANLTAAKPAALNRLPKVAAAAGNRE